MIAILTRYVGLLNTLCFQTSHVVFVPQAQNVAFFALFCQNIHHVSLLFTTFVQKSYNIV